jgi:hypothetical protein
LKVNTSDFPFENLIAITHRIAFAPLQANESRQHSLVSNTLASVHILHIDKQQMQPSLLIWWYVHHGFPHWVFMKRYHQ